CERLPKYADQPELHALACTLQEVLEQLKTNDLWGSFLLTQMYDAVYSVTPDPHRYRRVLGTVSTSPWAADAIKSAAKVLVTALPSEAIHAASKPLAMASEKHVDVPTEVKP